MATITQQPNQFGLAVGPNVWVLSTLNTANRFVLGVQIGGTTIATLKQTPNPAGVGIFDINLILQSYLASPFVEQTAKFAQTPGGGIRYRIRYGVETGSTITWQGYSSYKVVFNGYKPFNDLNWNEYGFYIPFMEEQLCPGPPGPNTYTSCPIGEVNFLTSYPETIDLPALNGVPNQKVIAGDSGLDEWATLSFANFNEQTWTGNDAQNKTPWAVVIRYYNAANTNYDTRAYTLTAANGMNVRSDCNSGVAAIPDTYLMGAIGSGPKNLRLANLWPPQTGGATPSYYTIELYTKACGTVANCANTNDILNALGCLISIHSYTVVDNCSKFEPMRLSFLNEFGGRDYYTFTMRNTYTENIKRNTYFRDAGSWSASSYTVNSYERGTQTFNSTATAQMLVSTDWVNDDISIWLEKLFTSPEVKLWYNDEWISVNLTTSNYQQKTVVRDNKVYRYELNLEFSQPQQRQRG